ncbi:phage baseplate assembly protein V [Amycolatopsis sp. OK19-0408]|uniref:Phage baseplate assembly protein V n=1 Tax=Amycolatopsis iheyensis TaxID=2945988 RepID=A0A9X2SP54_9PSEU|nr:phage baseplate assembly protein V [Amycolatopsis iheyensis]MCR6487826.1 phage baseplate assembly protein V [Amycolatopsis iheyensis]
MNLTWWQADNLVQPSIHIGPAKRPLPADVARSVLRVTVDTHLHLPDMFEITVTDRAASAHAVRVLAIGTEVAIGGAAPGRPEDPRLLMSGEVTAIEAEYAATASIVFRGYAEDHRLQRAKRTRTFLDATDADIARKIATEAGLPLGVIEPTRVTHRHVGQVNQTDWDFLVGRAAAIGYHVGVTAGRFEFRPAAERSKPVTLELGENLVSFSARITAGNLAPRTEVRVWDPLAARVVSEHAAPAETTARLADDPAAVASRFAGVQPHAPQGAASAETTPAGPASRLAGTKPSATFGPAPAEPATVVSDRPLAWGAAIGAAAKQAAAGLSERMSDTFAEAVGEAIGDPWLTAGRMALVRGVAGPFAGTWLLTRARHEFGSGTYRTTFEVSGRHDRSLLGLAAGGHDGVERIPGVVCGIVSDLNDPLRKGRVKVVLPWLSPGYESDWACPVQVGAGAASGTVFLPEVGDEVLVGFEFGDPRRPYVLGGIVNDHSRADLGGEAVRTEGATASVVRRGIVAPSGSRLLFHDGPPAVSQVELGTGTGDLTLKIDQRAGTVLLRCDPRPPGSDAAAGRLTIECGPAGTIDLRAGPGGTVTVDGGARLNLKAQAAIAIESAGVVEIKGNPIKLN